MRVCPVTNSVDQLKTRIQFGQFKHLGTAFRWQAKSKAEGGGGGLGKLFGRAAMIRACYIGHGCMVSTAVPTLTMSALLGSL